MEQKQETLYSLTFKYKVFGKTSSIRIKLTLSDIQCLAYDGYIFTDKETNVHYIYLVDLRDYMTVSQLMKTAAPRLIDEDEPSIRAYCKELLNPLQIVYGEKYVDDYIKPFTS